MFKRITKHIIIFLMVFVCLFTLSLTHAKADTELWRASSIQTVSNTTGWLVNENITPLTIGNHYQVRYSVSPDTFLGTRCTGDGIGDTDCIELGTGTHIIESWQVIYTATGGSGVWDFYPDQAYDYLDAYAWCPNTSGCTLTSFSLWEIGGSGPTPTPIPTVTEAPTPTPILSPPPTTSPTPIPVTKTVFIPGFGASWNADAFYNCTFDPDPKNWSLAPYAESVYNPLLSALSQPEQTTLPFYYDWRAPIITNSVALANKLTAVTSTGEKVNIVGHSMGGLVATDYLAHQNGNTKTNSVLVVGSPLKGTVQAYPSWSGGDVWEDNFITKVAMNLYLFHCGSLISGNRATIQSQIPSVQNLLPVFDYLKSGSKLKSWGSLVAQNDWLPLALDTNFWGIKFGTLTGNGFDTLSRIQVKDPGKRDILLDSQNWQDGKPTGKTYSTNGDGTVLLSSSKVDDAHNVTINQTHSGLVGSVEGMTEILKFLDPNLPWSVTSTFSEPNYALVIIGYPSNFWISDQNGSVKKDKDGMVTFINPESGNYKLSLIPKSNNTLFIVAQFLPNGDVKYKEYKFDGFAPKFKTLKFDLQNPTENILD